MARVPAIRFYCLTTTLRVVSIRERLISCLTDEVHRVEMGSPAKRISKCHLTCTCYIAACQDSQLICRAVWLAFMAELCKSCRIGSIPARLTTAVAPCIALDHSDSL